MFYIRYAYRANLSSPGFHRIERSSDRSAAFQKCSKFLSRRVKSALALLIENRDRARGIASRTSKYATLQAIVPKPTIRLHYAEETNGLRDFCRAT